MRIPVPFAETARHPGIHLPRRCERRAARRERMSEAAMTSYVYLRDNPAGRSANSGITLGMPRLARRHPRHQDASDRIGRVGQAFGPELTDVASATQPFRLPELGLIDRNAPLSFRFDGQSFSGFRGDTLASALLANGVRLVGRSFKYHRPRGILTAGPEEPNALVELRSGARREPNTRATVAELYEGLEARARIAGPRSTSISVDQRAARRRFAAGFYYKTFMWPAAFWEKLYEPLIRRAAGLGRAADAEIPTSTKRPSPFATCWSSAADPPGLSAALAAGRAGARVILCDEDFALGGRLLPERREIDGRPASQWLAQSVAELASCPTCTSCGAPLCLASTITASTALWSASPIICAMPPPHQPRQRAWRIVAKRAILAAGAIERPIVFGGNDRPASCWPAPCAPTSTASAWRPGAKRSIFTAGDDGWNTARDLAAAGVEDRRHRRFPRSKSIPALRALCESFGAPLHSGASVFGASGGKSLRRIAIRAANGGVKTLACDLLAVSDGWNPTIHLASHHRATSGLGSPRSPAFVAGRSA